MTSKLDEIKQRHANGYKGIEAERAFPDVAALLDEVARLRAENVRLDSLIDAGVLSEIERLTEDNTRLAECWTTEQETHRQTQAEVARLRASQSDLYEALRGFLQADFNEDLKPYFDAACVAMDRADALGHLKCDE